MKMLPSLLISCFACTVFAQTKTVTFTVVSAGSAAVSSAPKHIRAVLSTEDDSEHVDTLKIRFYPGPSKFVVAGQEGLLTWFSYTNPPMDRKRVFVEADQTTFGGLLYENILYVCTPNQPQKSLAVINQLLASVGSSHLSASDAEAIALLLAKCSNTLQVFGDPQSTSEDAQRRMEKIASPPTSTRVDGEIHVDFYSWSALPTDAISKWSLVFNAHSLVKVDRVVLSAARS
jgi:hypothetical protein